MRLREHSFVGGRDQDQWSKITQIMVHQRNQWFHSGHRFISSFDELWSEWSWITDPDPNPDHPKGMLPWPFTAQGVSLKLWSVKSSGIRQPKTSSNQRLWECIRCRINVYPDTLNDFPSWLSTSKNQPCFIKNRVLQKDISVTKSMSVAWRRWFP